MSVDASLTQQIQDIFVNIGEELQEIKKEVVEEATKIIVSSGIFD